ncbi:MAG TPA: hypothetical protein PLD27_13195 [bacterium]|nr:hypothetical protein [bacterium]HPQ19216.1 hypothetical protein [bacterium]
MDEKSLLHIKKSYKFKKLIRNSLIKYFLFLLIFFLVFSFVINFNIFINTTKYYTYFLISKFYHKFFLKEKKELKQDEKISDKKDETINEEKNIQTKEKINLDEYIDKLYKQLATTYKKVYGADYERYLKRDLIKKVHSKYYSNYGDEADFFLREDYNFNKPEIANKGK